MSAHEMPQLWSRHLDVAIEEGVVTISYKPPPDLTLGSAVRSRDLRNRVALKLKSGEQITARFDLDETRNLVIVIAKIDLMLDRYAGEPLSHRMVEEIARNNQRRASTMDKDGRLPKSGMASYSRGPKSFLSIYAPAETDQATCQPPGHYRAVAA